MILISEVCLAAEAWMGVGISLNLKPAAGKAKLEAAIAGAGGLMASGIKGKTLIELLRMRASHSPDDAALMHSVGGTWETLSWAEVQRATDEIAAGLLSLGLPLGARVGLLSRSRFEWVLADLAILKAGCCTVPLHANALGEQIQHILADSKTVAVLVENESQLAKVRCAHCYHEMHHVIVMRGPTRGPTEMRWDDLRAAGRSQLAEFPDGLAARARAVGPDSLASLVYTSGTTGQPKGVMLTHDNLVFEAEALALSMKEHIQASDLHLLCLPLSHILARIMVLAGITAGYANAFSSGLEALDRELLEVRPTFVTVVPAILEQLHTSFLQEIEGRNFVLRRMVGWARGVSSTVARKRHWHGPLGLRLGAEHWLANRLVLERGLKERLGGRIKFLISGGAALSVEIGEFFQSLGLSVVEGYGLTENVGAANVNRPERIKLGTVGPPIPGVEERIAADGEILIRGRNVMAGYFGMPEETEAALDAEGWLHTGDLGEIDEEGYLRVTGRKKDLIVTSTGKNVAPLQIESLLRTSPYIAQAMVCGDGRRYLTALIVLDPEQVQHFAEKQGLPFDRIGELLCNPQVRQLLQTEVDACNRRLNAWETVRNFAILSAPFSLDAGEITPTLKLRRQELVVRYRDLIEAMYEEPSSGHEAICLEDA